MSFSFRPYAYARYFSRVSSLGILEIQIIIHVKFPDFSLLYELISGSGKTEEEVTSFCQERLGTACNATETDIDMTSAITKCVTDVQVSFQHQLVDPEIYSQVPQLI